MLETYNGFSSTYLGTLNLMTGMSTNKNELIISNSDVDELTLGMDTVYGLSLGRNYNTNGYISNSGRPTASINLQVPGSLGGYISLRTSLANNTGPSEMMKVANSAITLNTALTGTSAYFVAITGTSLSLSGTTASTSTSTGSLVVAGGVGVAGTINIAGSIKNTSQVISSTNTTTGTYPLWIINNNPTYNAPTLCLSNTGAGGYGTAAGIDFQTYSGYETKPAASIRAVGDGNWSAPLSFYVKIAGADNGLTNVCTMSHTGAIINTSTISTSTSTGSLIVAGGVGIAGSLYVGSDDRAKRYRPNQGTAYSGADAAVVLSSGWGTTPTVVATGYDPVITLTITAKATTGASPTITITFKDGTWTTAPTYIVSRNDASVPLVTTAYVTWTTSATQLIITFNGTPTANNVYTFVCIGMGV